jgi:hypothetical protein
MRDFEKTVNLLVDGLIDTANELLENDEVQAYFKEHYNYEDGLDDRFHMLIQYIHDKY